MHTSENDHIRFSVLCLLCQAKAVADVICHILNIRLLVVVRQYHGVFFFFQVLYLCKKVK